MIRVFLDVALCTKTPQSATVPPPFNWQISHFIYAPRLIDSEDLQAMRTQFRLLACLAVVLPMVGGPSLAQDVRVPSSASEIRLSYAPVVKRVAPAVVNVYAARVVENRVPLFDDPIFRRFFGGAAGARAKQVQRSLGSGVIVDPSGLVVTNYPRHRECRPGQGLARRQARIRGRDRAARTSVRISQCCASRMPTRNSPPSIFGDSDALQVGDVVLAHRQSVRRRPNGDARHRLGGGAHPGRHHRLSVLHPDRRRHQSRQFRRRAGRSRRHDWSASIPRSSRAPAARRASALPFPPTWCASWSPRPRAAARRSSGPGSAPSCRR